MRAFQKRKRRWFVLAALFASCVFAGCGRQPVSVQEPKAEKSIFAMSTFITITAYGEDSVAALEEAENVVCQWESLLSVTDTDSEIFALNHSRGRQVQVSEETEEVLVFALRMAEETGGVLEPTIYPVLTAWGFTTDSHQVPSADELSRLLETVGYEKVQISDGQVQMPDGMQIDLGAVAKGYVSDRIVEILEDNNVSSALLNLGGNIHAYGTKPDGSLWRIGLKMPGEDGNFGTLEVSNAAVVTSGGYQNYFVGEDGNTYHHIIDPTTGRPAMSGLASVTVIAGEGKLCDALSTAFFVMGRSKAEEYWRQHGDFDMILVTDSGEIYLTEGIRDSFTANEAIETQNVHIIKNDQ